MANMNPNTANLKLYSYTFSNIFRLILCLYLFIDESESSADWSVCEGRIVDQSGNLFDDLTIDFSGVHIHLMNTEGYVKQTISCAPNGYYSMPIEGETRAYLLKIEGPDGWHFSPSSYHVQGNCDKPQNFTFEGFNVIGNVVSKLTHQGVEGIKLILHQKNRLTSTAITQADGQYVFGHILPGHVTIETTEPAYHFIKDIIESEVMDNTLFIEENFIIDGYPVNGQLVYHENNYFYPIWKGLAILLTPKQPIPENICKLTSSELEQELTDAQFVYMDMEGNFSFNQIIVGSHQLVICGPPDQPESTTSGFPYLFEVKDSAVWIKPAFEILTFVQIGKVFTIGGTAIEGAIVTVDNDTVLTTNEEGLFFVPNATSGLHSVQVSYPHTYFDKEEINFSYVIEDPIEIVPTAYDICGGIYLPSDDLNLSENSLPDVNAQISHVNEAGLTTVSPTNQGMYCLKSEPGNYTLSVYVDPLEKWSYLTIPTSHQITITDYPLENINFYKQMFTLEIFVTADEFSEFQFDFTLEKYTQDKEIFTDPIQFTGKNYTTHKILPGKYLLSVDESNCCFDDHQMMFETGKDDTVKINFNSTGIKLNGTASDDCTVLITDKSDNQKFDKSYDLQSGSFSICLPYSQSYIITPNECYSFENDSYTFESSTSTPINIKIKEKSLIGSISIDNSITQSDIEKLNFLVSSQDEQGKLITSVKPHFNHETFKFDYQMWVPKDAELITIYPQLINEEDYGNFKFSPPQMNSSDSLKPSQGCLFCSEIKLKSGKYIYIHFNPVFGDEFPLTIQTSKGNIVYEHIVKANSENITIGPIFEDLDQPLKAHFEGYHLIQDEHNIFNASKISSIKVQFNLSFEDTEITSFEEASLLLTSLDDTNYKEKKTFTSSQDVIFYDIPAGQYFLQPFLKEFAFTPNQQTVKITQGENLLIDWMAKKVAFSCYGKIQTLFNFQFEFEQLIIEAKNDQYGLVDTMADSQGNFQLKGLTPNADYSVTVIFPDQLGDNPTIKVSPPSQIVNLQSKDLEGIIFHIFPNSTNNISGKIYDKDPTMVMTVELFSPNEQKVVEKKQLYLNNYFEFPGVPYGSYTLKIAHSESSEKKKKQKNKIFYEQDLTLTKENIWIDVVQTTEKPEESTYIELESNTKSSPLISILVLCFLFYFYLKSTELIQYLPTWNSLRASNKQKIH